MFFIRNLFNIEHDILYPYKLVIIYINYRCALVYSALNTKLLLMNTLYVFLNILKITTYSKEDDVINRIRINDLTAGSIGFVGKN